MRMTNHEWRRAMWESCEGREAFDQDAGQDFAHSELRAFTLYPYLSHPVLSLYSFPASSSEEYAGGPQGVFLTWGLLHEGGSISPHLLSLPLCSICANKDEKGDMNATMLLLYLVKRCNPVFSPSPIRSPDLYTNPLHEMGVSFGWLYVSERGDWLITREGEA